VQPLAAGQARFIPGKGALERIKVQEPFGVDIQLMFAFDSPPPGLGKMHNIREVEADDPRLLAFERSIESQSGKFTFATSSLRTLKP
jgi:hypothetical protein